jgi:hypothetical protein
VSKGGIITSKFEGHILTTSLYVIFDFSLIDRAFRRRRLLAARARKDG